MKRAYTIVLLVTLYLLAYTIICHTNPPQWLPALMFTLSPFLMIYMVYTVLRFGIYNGPELQPDEEWGYQDAQEIKSVMRTDTGD